MKRNKIAVLFLLICGALFAQDKPRETKVILEDLRYQINELNEINNQREEALIEKENTIAELNDKTNKLLEEMNLSVKDLSKANETIIKQNQSLKTQRKWLIVLTAILGIFSLAHFVILYLKLRYKISLPYWLNALI